MGMVTEYTLAGHGSAMPGDNFDYTSLAHWFVNQFNQFGVGSMVWNFDAKSDMPSWGTVAAAHVGNRPVDWHASWIGLFFRIRFTGQRPDSLSYSGTSCRCASP